MDYFKSVKKRLVKSRTPEDLTNIQCSLASDSFLVNLRDEASISQAEEFIPAQCTPLSGAMATEGSSSLLTPRSLVFEAEEAAATTVLRSSTEQSSGDLEHASVSSVDAKDTELKLTIAQTTISMLEDKIKTLETMNSKLEGDKFKLEIYARKTIANFKDKYMALLQTIKTEKETLESQFALFIEANERNFQTFRREERLLRSSMYELGVRLMEKHIEDNMQRVIAPANTFLGSCRDITNIRLAEITRERDSATNAISVLNSRLAEITRERDSATNAISGLNSRLAEITRERDLFGERLKFCSEDQLFVVRVKELSSHRDELLKQRRAFQYETNTLWKKLFGYLMAPTICNSKASEYLNCLTDIPDVSVEEALVSHVDRAFFCKLKGLGIVDESWRAVLLNSIRDHKVRGVTISGRNVPSTDSLNIHGVSEEEKLAIRIYTAQIPVKYFQHLNSALNDNDRTPQLIREMKLYMRVLIKGLQSLAVAQDGKYLKRVQVAYRGVHIKDNEFYRRKVQLTMTLLGHHIDIPCAAEDKLGAIEPFRIGEPITFSAFTSITVDSVTMDKFSDHLYFMLHDVVGLDISTLSAYPSEQELLLPPPSIFQITALSPLPQRGLLMVHLKQVPPDASYLPLSPFPDVPQDHDLRKLFAAESTRPVLEVVEETVKASTVAGRDRDLHAAYGVLTDPVNFSEALTTCLDRLGVYSELYLAHVPPAEIEELAGHLKSVPSRIFLVNMGLSFI